MKDYKYLSKFPKPLLEDIVNDLCLPIIGAGFSKNADIPSGLNMPDWDGLGRAIANLIPDYQYINALDALSAYSFEYSRTNLIEKVSDLLLIDSIEPGETHKAFCNLPFELIVTTNFEFLLEKGYTNIKKTCRPIIDENQLCISSKNQIVDLLKLHGDINHPTRLVITEDDYDRFLMTYPMLSTYITNLLITKTPLFIGYSLDDNDFRQIWQLIKDRLGNLKRQAYTIRVDCTQNEIARFERRNVKVINIDGNKKKYPIILKEIFEELSDYWETEIINHNTITTEEALAELVLPLDTRNRICFFSIPINLLSFYKKFIFPIVKNYGFVPTTAEDIITEGDNWTAGISALIKRAELVVVDYTTSNTEYELFLANSHKKGFGNILLITDGSDKINSSIISYSSINRNIDPQKDIDSLVNSFEMWIMERSEHFKETFANEPNRLILKKEYRSAVISVFTLFEIKLKESIPELKEMTDQKFPISVYQLVKVAAELQIISKEEFYKIREWNEIRNQLVHTTKGVNHNQAKGIVKGLYRVISKLQELQDN